MNNSIDLIKPVKTEEGTIEFYTVQQTGESGMSQRGLAILCGKSQSTISRLVDALMRDSGPKRLKRFRGKGLTLCTTKESELTVNGSRMGTLAIYNAGFCTAVINYYAADDDNETAQDSSDKFAEMGITHWIQKITGWQDPSQRRLTSEEIAELCIFTAGRQWQKRFDDVFYAHLSKVTGLSCNGHKRPKLFAALTNEFVYDRMPKGVSAKLRQCREETGGWQHLHRFLSDDGLQLFEKHMQNLLLLMAAATSVNQLRGMIREVDAKAYQLQLFSDCRKDGKLTVFNHLKQ